MGLAGTPGWSGSAFRRATVALIQILSTARQVRMRVTGHAPPRDGASSYEHHDFEKEAFAAVEKLAAEIERISRAVPISGGG